MRLEREGLGGTTGVGYIGFAKSSSFRFKTLGGFGANCLSKASCTVKPIQKLGSLEKSHCIATKIFYLRLKVFEHFFREFSVFYHL